MERRCHYADFFVEYLDVLAEFALGTASGIYAHSRSQPMILSTLPHGFMVGLRKRF